MGVNLRKRRTRRRLTDSPESVDRISSLSDEVLGRILSLLPTKYAVATSILSSRWKSLYRLCTTLDFDDSLHFNTRNYLGNERKDLSFRKFVNDTLSRCKMSCISKFRLKCGYYHHKNYLFDWINAAFLHKVSELEVSIDMVSIVPGALRLFQSSCVNLVVLKLDFTFKLCVSNSVTFPRLRVLYLKGIMFQGNSSICFTTYCKPSSDDHGLNGILFGCPLLEELVINGCDWGGGDLYFSNPLLRRLTLDPGKTGPLDQLVGCTVYFDLPSLVYFNYSDGLAEQYEIRNLNSVNEAHLEISFNDDEYEEQQDLCDVMLELINGIQTCQSLNLSSQCLEALTSGDSEELIKLPNFCNLSRLSLDLGHDVSWNDVLLDFLQSSPRLESLILKQGLLKCKYSLQEGELLLDGEGDDDFMLTNEAVPYCVHSQLKSVNIKEFRGLTGEIQMIMYFLVNAHILEEMMIHWDKRVRKRDSISKEKEILKLPKSSISCSITFK